MLGKNLETLPGSIAIEKCPWSALIGMEHELVKGCVFKWWEFIGMLIEAPSKPKTNRWNYSLDSFKEFQSLLMIGLEIDHH